MFKVHSLHTSAEHLFSKTSAPSIRLIEGVGVEGDAHAGPTVQHRSRVAKDPSQPNLRQVHLLSFELIQAVRRLGFDIEAGHLGENITTQGIELHDLSRDTRLLIGSTEIKLTGLRNPCQQIENFSPGLLAQVVSKSSDGDIIRRAGIMGVVTQGGVINTLDEIRIIPPNQWVPLAVV